MASSGQGSERLNAQLLVDSIPALIHTARPDGYLDYFNKPWLEYLGVTLDKVTGWNWTAVIHPEDVEGILAKWRACLATGEVFEYETRVRSANGEYRWMFHRKVPLRDANGNIVKWYGSSLDIDERKTAEEQLSRNGQELQRSEFYLAEGQRLAHMGSWAWNVRTGTLFWSEETFRIYGYSAQETGPAWEQFLQRVHPKDRAQIEQRAKMEASGKEWTESHGDFRVVLPDGTVKYLHSVAHPVRHSGELTEVIGTVIDVTEHELLTQELRRREAYLAEAQKLSHTGSFGWKPDTGEIVWSEETYRIFEYDRSVKPTIDSVVQRVHPQDRADFQKVIDGASRGATDFEHTYRLLLPDGQVEHVHAIARAVQDASGNREFVGAATDITERKRAEEHLRASERKYRHLVDTTPAFIHTALPDGSLDFLSRGWLEYGGLPQTDFLDWRWTAAIHPEDVEGFVDKWRAALASGEPFVAESRVRRSDGEYRWFLQRNVPLRDKTGKIVKWYGTGIDIEERKRAEKELGASERKYRDLVDTTPAFVNTALPNGDVDFFNQGWEEYAGLPFMEMLGWRWTSAIHPEDVEAFVEKWRAALESRERFVAEARVRRADGEYRWFLQCSEPLRKEAGEIVKWYGTGIEIEERKIGEQEIRAKEIELQQIVNISPQHNGVFAPSAEALYL